MRTVGLRFESGNTSELTCGRDRGGRQSNGCCTQWRAPTGSFRGDQHDSMHRPSQANAGHTCSGLLIEISVPSHGLRGDEVRWAETAPGRGAVDSGGAIPIFPADGNLDLYALACAKWQDTNYRGYWLRGRRLDLEHAGP